MTGLDVTEFVRTIANEQDPNQRWSEPQLLSLVNRAQKVIMRTLLWPQARYIFNTAVGVQEYREPEIFEVLHVYIQGQPIVRSDISTLQGDQLYMYDQTGMGGGPGGLVVEGHDPNLAGGQFTPKWTGQAAATYPVSSPLGYPAPVAAPWYAGRRPVYYFRSGVMGFVPPPSGIYPVVVDCVRNPEPIRHDSDELVLPDLALDAVAWKVIEYMCFSNADQNAASDQRNYALTEYKQAMDELKGWSRGYDGKGTKGPKVLTQRSFYTRGNNRNWGAGNS